MSSISSKGALLDGFYFKFVFCIFEAFCNEPEVLAENVTLRYRKINVLKNTSLLSKETKSTMFILTHFHLHCQKKGDYCFLFAFVSSF